MKLIIDNRPNKHVSFDTVLEFERIISNDVRVSPISFAPKYISVVLYYLWILFDRVHYKNSRVLPVFSDEKSRDKSIGYFVVLMGLDKLKCLPYFLLCERKSVYLFDAWPNRLEKIKQFIKGAGVKNVFISSRQSVERLAESVKGCNFYWVPEGVDINEYLYYPYHAKDIDVLHLGRRYEEFHNIILKPLEAMGRTYLYNKNENGLIFPSRKQLIHGFARSKISICVPCNITNPKRSGDIETMTVRYLQSMASKCIILGHAPAEMISLFGYNPVIEIDMRDPVHQINQILESYCDYFPLIEKNFKTVASSHTWQNRWDQISRILFAN
jgi:hypothetical protein